MRTNVMFDSKEMVNDDTYFLATAKGKVYPNKVVPFEYEGIELFCHRDYIGKALNPPDYQEVDEWDTYWVCTEKSTGLSMNALKFKTAIRARADAEDRMRMAKPEYIKKIITDCLNRSV